MNSGYINRNNNQKEFIQHIELIKVCYILKIRFYLIVTQLSCKCHIKYL